MSLREKLEEMQRAKRSTGESVRQKLPEWIASVSNLYAQVEELLSDLKNRGLLQFNRRSVQRTEELTGAYKIDELMLRAGGRTITFSPVGLFVIGAYGRVDLFAEGRLDLRYFLLRDKADDGKDRWVITPSHNTRRQPLPHLPELSRANLEEAIEKLLSI